MAYKHVYFFQFKCSKWHRKIAEKEINERKLTCLSVIVENYKPPKIIKEYVIYQK